MAALVTFFSLLKATYRAWSDDRAPRLGAALAYYTVFSISPLLLVIITVAGLVFGRDAVRGRLFEQLNSLMGSQTADFLNGAVSSAYKSGDNIWLSVVAVIVILLGATGFFAQLQDALDTIWKVVPKGSEPWTTMLWRYWWSLSMILGTGFLLLVSLVFSAVLAGVTAMLPFADVLQLLNFASSLLVSSILFGLIFRFVPHVTLPWGIALRGGFFTATLFAIGKTLLGYYLGKTAVASGYGAAGALVIFLLWVYYSAQILLFGAEFTKVLALSKSVKVAVDQGYELPELK